MEVKILTLKFEGHKIDRRDIPKIRGYLASCFPQYTELHNHLDNNRYKYGYPIVQYKTIDGTPAIIAINEAVDTVIDIIYNIDEINIKDKILPILEKGFTIRKAEIGETPDMNHYRFLNPWMALNQENYLLYKAADDNGKKDLLKRVLIGNILSLSKYMNYQVKNTIDANIFLEPVMVKFKNKDMVAFKGEFWVNFNIPNYLGIGKSVSRGFGAVVRVK